MNDQESLQELLDAGDALFTDTMKPLPMWRAGPIFASMKAKSTRFKEALQDCNHHALVKKLDRKSIT